MENDAAQEYRQAFAEWMAQLERLHRVLLEGERLPPAQMKGLLNHEARAKERYERARRRLLGLRDDGPDSGGGSPFR